MVHARLAISLAAVLLIGGLAGSARSSTGAPTNLHGFLLRADEPANTSFPRTPAFAWSPVSGALHYEFQLSLSSVFRDNSVIWADDNVAAPVIAPDITLPWITGNPHSLYARVRAMTAAGASPWSASYGFDLAPPPAPTPLPSYPGLLRWTPVDGAAGYEVWLLDAGKMEVVTTNVLDERELYTFHTGAAWTGTVRWRVRALRPDVKVSGSGRLNSIPVVQYGPWSSVYSATNPTFASGALQLVGTASDVMADGSNTAPAERLMPAFAFTGNTSLSGQQAELFRVEVFTDKECLNRVFTGPVIGSPAYAPRPFGPLAMPTSSSGIITARTMYLADGTEPVGVALDGDTLATTESQPDASPTGSAPPAPGAPTGGSTTGSGSGSSSSDSSSSSSSSTSSSSAPSSAPANGTVTWSGRTGAPVDLWDVNWPGAGYYWTVVPVAAVPKDAITTSVVGAGALKGDKSIPVASTAGFSPGDVIQVGSGSTAETLTVTLAGAAQLTVASALANAHSVGETVTRTSGAIIYRDLDLAQDACAAGRVQRFGKASEPSLTSSGEVFATGMSVDGRLTSARHTTAFYGQPLISWTPALGANAYEVQWSKTRYPFKPEVFGTLNGYVTTGTSLVLPVTPGTWYYRVRGFDYSLPTGSQQMSWSDTARLVVAKPKFKVVVAATKAKPKAAPKKKSSPSASSSLKRITGAGFTMLAPKTWRAAAVNGTPGYQNVDGSLNVTWSAVTGDPTSQAASYAGFATAAGGSVSAISAVKLPSGDAKLVTAAVKNTKGDSVDDLVYFIPFGKGTLVVGFEASPSAYKANLDLFAEMINSLRLTS